MHYKNQYLANTDHGVATISYEEYLSITAANANLPTEEKRYFIKDEIRESDHIDRMYIEVSYEKYLHWHAEQQRLIDHGAFDAGIEVLSLDAIIDNECASLQDFIAAKDDLEETAAVNWIIDQLYSASKKWAPWGEDMLSLLLLGTLRTSNEFLTQKYGFTERTLYRRKQEFSQFIKKTYKSLAV